MDTDTPANVGDQPRENVTRPRRYRGQKTTNVEVPIFDKLPDPPPPPPAESNSD